MSKKTRPLLYIDEATRANLLRMVEVLKSDHPYLKVSVSQLASLILNQYADVEFQKKKESLIDKFLDKKTYIRHLLSTTDSTDELIKRIIELERTPPTVKRRQRRKQDQPTVPESPDGGPSRDSERLIE